MSPSLGHDEPARQRAVDPRFNVALQASAGTGKTRVLVDRYVNMLSQGVDPSNILAITFTRKAAAEMRERIVATLRAAEQQGTLAPARWRELRDRLGDIAISTIDAFCLSLLREFPLEADVDPAFRMADDTEVPRLVDESLDRTFRICRSLAREDEALALLFAQLGERRTRQGLAALLNRRLVVPALLTRFLAKGPRDLTAAGAGAQLVRAVDDALAAMPGGAEAFFANGPATPGFALIRLALADRRPEALPAFVARVRECFLTQEGAPRRKPPLRIADYPSDPHYRRYKEALLGQAEAVHRALTHYRQQLNAVMARGVRRMYEIAEGEYRKTLDAHAVVDFSDVLLRALDLLRQMDEFSQSRFRLESRYHHILVDEFQDTSHPQWDLVSLLVRSWGEGAGLAYSGPFQPTIFVVGDPKQSIYGFRDADASILDAAGRFLEGLREDGEVRHAISRSYRSVPALLAFVNDVCHEMALAVRPGAFRYDEADRFPVMPGEEAAPERADAAPEVAHALGLIGGPTSEVCADRLAAELDRLLRHGTVRDRDTGLPRRMRPGDVAILFRSRDSHRAFEHALEARGIPAYVYKGLGFFDADEIKDVLALLWYLATPASELRATAWLRSRMVGLSDEALRRLAPRLADALTRREEPAALAATGPAGLAPDDAARLRQARAAAARWLPLVDRLPPAELLDVALREAAYAAELRGPRLAQGRENLKKIRALVRRIQNRGYLTLARVTDYIERLSLGDESSAVVDALDAVNLMTVHASKGLEFPVVCVVNLSRGTGSRGDPIRVSADGPDEDPASVSIGDFRSDADEALPEKEREETKRLMYVALTRARDRLYLASVLKDGALRPGRGSLAEVLPPSLQAAFSDGATPVWTTPAGQMHRLVHCGDGPPPEPPSPVGANPLERPDDFAPLEAQATGVAVTAPAAAVEPLPTALPTTQPGWPAVAAASERVLGVLVHRLFERYGLHPTLDATDVRALLPVMADEDLPQDDAVRDDLAARALAAYRDLADQRGVQAAFASGTRYHEVPFALRDGGIVVRGSIDCLIHRDDGGVTVVEFKTGQPRPEHAQQVETYRRAVSLLFPGASVDATLIYARPSR